MAPRFPDRTDPAIVCMKSHATRVMNAPMDALDNFLLDRQTEKVVLISDNMFLPAELEVWRGAMLSKFA